MKPHIPAFCAAVLTLLASNEVSATTPADVGLPLDRIERSMACISVLMVSASYVADGTLVGYEIDDLNDVAGLNALWVSSMTGFSTDDIYARPEVAAYADKYDASTVNKREQLDFCMSNMPDE